MLNPYIWAQIVNMKATVNNCRQACQWAARKDDNIVDAEERKALKKIDAAVERFIRELDKIH